MTKQKMAVVCNGDTPANIMPTLIFSTSGITLDYEVHVFVSPAGARWFVKGELEKLGTPKGMPNPVKLFCDLLNLGGEVVFWSWRWKTRTSNLRPPRPAHQDQEGPALSAGRTGATQTYVF